jgi:hypothetical protein
MLVCRFCNQAVPVPAAGGEIPPCCPQSRMLEEPPAGPRRWERQRPADGWAELLGSSKHLLQGLLVVGVIGVAVAARFWLAGHLARFDEFNKDLKEWQYVPALTAPSAYLRGKVLPVNLRPPSGGPVGVDAAFYDALPSELRATSPKEVETVLLLEWGQKHHTRPKDYFTVYDMGYTSTCTVTVIDRRAMRTLGKKTFSGPSPVGTGKYGGEKPYKEMVAYVLGLPRKK